MTLIKFFVLAVCLATPQILLAKTQKYDLRAETESFLLSVSGDQFNADNCSEKLNEAFDALYSTKPTDFDVQRAISEMPSIIENLWQSRLSLRQRLRGFIKSEGFSKQVITCATSTKQALRAIRYLEDYVGELTLKPEPFDFDKYGKNKQVRKSDLINKNTPPHFLVHPSFDQITIQSGDVIISRGSAFTSAAIARIGEVDAQFSHLALVYIDQEFNHRAYSLEEAIKSPHVKVIEAHIEVGTTIRTFSEYLEDGNARLLFYRFQPEDLSAIEASAMAQRGAQFSFDFVNNYVSQQRAKRLQGWDDPDYGHIRPPIKEVDVNDNVPYDFQMQLGDTSEVFCSEWGYIAYNHVGVNLPQFPTAIPKENALSKALGITVKETFAPGDMDTETRFVLQGEWRDYRKVRNMRHKDAVLTKIFEWMEQDQWTFEVGFTKNLQALFAWITRHMDLEFTKDQLPKNMTVEALKTVFALDKVGAELQKYTEAREKIYMEETGGLLMPFSEMLVQLETARTDFVCKPWSPLYVVMGQTGLKVKDRSVCR
ncbi:MAG: hypothetical protein H6626_13790 [Pseudobdellovibrionaceae bacterium]|nr:hypothetical protein [Bdellovibrionales bacterium]USN47242.1 MAG: hypothetical protein H6626_13790 [Pseudobdellovibrionaceae bacterium]